MIRLELMTVDSLSTGQAPRFKPPFNLTVHGRRIDVRHVLINQSNGLLYKLSQHSHSFPRLGSKHHHQALRIQVFRRHIQLLNKGGHVLELKRGVVDAIEAGEHA